MRPGESSFVEISFSMDRSMGGPHLFLITLSSNDAVEPEKELRVRANIGP